ncbi:MAG: aspartate/tyrosine/aromatic aminotransferase [Akkermansiaceae bacterium]|nr:aspartate/tyrosine/aromatic aminotransferase [Akkermansiaceae bacterium]
MLETIATAPPDPILGLTEAFNADSNPDKVNLGVGIYKDAEGRTPTLDCIREAEKIVAAGQTSGGGYLPMTGLAEYDQLTIDLLFGPASAAVREGRVLAAQTPGGTGGLRVAGDFIHAMFPEARIWMSCPTWANHKGIFTASGIAQESYPYYDHATGSLDFDGMTAALSKVPAGDVVLLHACCHNPSGMDPDPAQWKQLAALAAERGFLALFDCAYQGFGDDIDRDVAGLRAFADAGLEMLVASSYSKNFGLYNQRIGAFSVVAPSPDAAMAAMSQAKLCIRVNYSNPPAHGARLVAAVLGDDSLRARWQTEVAAMRDRINSVRRKFVETMASKTDRHDFSFITTQRGMFSFSGLSTEQVHALRDKHAIYMVDSGRISVAGLNDHNLERVCSAIASVL